MSHLHTTSSILIRALSSGIPSAISLSKRPALLNAVSMLSGLFVVPLKQKQNYGKNQTELN